MCEGRPTQRASPRYCSPRRELSPPTTPIRLEGEAVEEEEEEEEVEGQKRVTITPRQATPSPLQDHYLTFPLAASSRSLDSTDWRASSVSPAPHTQSSEELYLKYIQNLTSWGHFIEKPPSQDYHATGEVGIVIAGHFYRNATQHTNGYMSTSATKPNIDFLKWFCFFSTLIRYYYRQKTPS